MLKVLYKNNEDGRTEELEFKNKEALINHMIDELNEYAGVEDHEKEFITTKRKIKREGNTFFSTVWKEHHTWTIVKNNS